MRSPAIGDEPVPDWEKIADIGVDAGMVWVGDPAYSMTPDTPYVIASDWDGFVKNVFERPFEGQGFARFEKADDWGDVGVAVMSGMGDGVYPLYVRRDPTTGRVAELRLVFIEESPSN
jgi:hypothetical protein